MDAQAEEVRPLTFHLRGAIIKINHILGSTFMKPLLKFLTEGSRQFPSPPSLITRAHLSLLDTFQHEKSSSFIHGPLGHEWSAGRSGWWWVPAEAVKSAGLRRPVLRFWFRCWEDSTLNYIEPSRRLGEHVRNYTEFCQPIELIVLFNDVDVRMLNSSDLTDSTNSPWQL